MPELPVDGSLSVSLDLSGTLLWDLIHGHLRSLELRGEGDYAVELGREAGLRLSFDLDLDLRASARRP